MKILAVITARAHSRRLPNKNFIRIEGLSLTQNAVAVAAQMRQEGLVEDVFLSTDSAYLMASCRRFALISHALRDPALSGSRVKSVDVVLDVLDQCRKLGKTYDAILLLQPTSPLRNAQDVRGAVNLFRQETSPSLITAFRMHGVSINGLYRKTEGGFLPVSPEHGSGKRRQELEPIYLRNGAVFMVNTQYMQETRRIISDCPAVYEMPPERSLDLDDREDWEKILDVCAGGETFRQRQKQAGYCGGLSTGKIRELSASAEELPLFPELVSLCMFDLCRRMTPAQAQTWYEDHCYFDGTAVLEDGECINDRLIPLWQTWLARREQRNFWKAFAEEKTALAGFGADSVVFVSEEV